MRVAAKLLGISSKKITEIWRSYFSRGLTLSGLHFVGGVGGQTNKQTERQRLQLTEGPQKDWAPHTKTNILPPGRRIARAQDTIVYIVCICCGLLKKNGCLVPGLVE